MKKGYIIVRIRRTREEGWAEYRAEVTKLVSEYGGRYIVRGGAVDPLEGDYGGQQFVVLEFPSLDIAQSFWRSAAYNRIKTLRVNSGEVDAWAVTGA